MRKKLFALLALVALAAMVSVGAFIVYGPKTEEKEGVKEEIKKEVGEKYPEPRMPSYLREPKSIEEVMPFARAAVRQTGGRTPLGLVKSGMTALLITEAEAEDMILEAIKRAYEERGVKVKMMGEYELAGASREGAREARKATRFYTAEQGHMEILAWLERAFDNPEVPRKWLKERRPDLYEALYPQREVPKHLAEASEKLKSRIIIAAIMKYLDENPDVDAFFWRRGGRRVAREFLHHRDKFYGNFIFDNRWEVMNKVPSFSGDIWKLTEEKVIEPLAWLDKAHVTDPEGTNYTFELTQKEAETWSKGAYQQGHLFMLPFQATGKYPYSVVEYPKRTEEWLPKVMTKASGIIAGTNNHTGSYPRIEVHLNKGYISEVKGGGLYGEIWREFLKYPNINELRYPLLEGEYGYWWINEAGLGTNPAFFKRPDENLSGTNSTERNVGGVIHWGFGISIPKEVAKKPELQESFDFSKKYNLPNDHWWHIHNLLLTYKVRVRGTDQWLTIIDKGRMTALDSPEMRALASRYGNPDEILEQAWRPHLPGINTPGSYEDYAQNPWKTQKEVIDKVLGGTYEYFYPPLKTK